MLVRVVRAVTGTLLLLVGLPVLLAGGALWLAMQHRDPGGAYTASLAGISTVGHAIVVSDVDELLRRDVPFARSGRTSLRLTATTPAGPAFIGLAPASEVARYLTDVPYARVREVRLARGPLPVTVAPVDGAAAPAGPPREQPFWAVASGTGTLEWVPSEERGRELALVIMDRAGTAPVTIQVTAAIRPEWLTSATVGALVLGGVLVLVAVGVLAWAGCSREIVYVVRPTQIPPSPAGLGVLPLPAAGMSPLRSPPPPPARPDVGGPVEVEFIAGAVVPPTSPEPEPPGPVAGTRPWPLPVTQITAPPVAAPPVLPAPRDGSTPIPVVDSAGGSDDDDVDDAGGVVSGDPGEADDPGEEPRPGHPPAE